MKSVKILLLTVVAAILTSCGTTSTVPITGRKQSLMVSDEEVLSLSNQQYQEYMKTAKKSTNTTNTAMVQRVGQRLANAVVSYLNSNGLARYRSTSGSLTWCRTIRSTPSACPAERLWSMKDCCLSVRTRPRWPSSSDTK